ncbi:flagellar biosynthesis protein FlhF [Geobacillus subterraneus]|uniref:Flagellar biosynthesis protein FlhF n=2 Tax=Geobacillus TaxID=129337 RepID=A0ABN4NH71_9BACL|nr:MULTISPECIES: flagellar biosynthesis protein FlhF [Geobacillus]AMX84023.1 flagellar biosynthesis protein FlhF [Geobacillus subterraneus]KZS26816.1 flagellar biosynthesis protein FlhF [Geobacillus subterraneus]OXB88231.1 flagellar biosynthesis protein FlhF [Geobacillus uzenensis]WPZ19530.1 flagellar biosynthesis protein FlhF [Geobacillus subterraneus]
MKVKKFVAPSMNEAMKMVRAELGRDAVILHSKVIHTGGFFGLFAKKKIEVLAGVDPDPLPRPPAAAAPADWPSAVRQEETNGSLAGELQEVKTLIRQLASRPPSLVYPPPLAEAERRLVRQGMAERYVREVMDRLLERWYADKGGRSASAVAGWAKEAVRGMLSPLPFAEAARQKKYVILLGPTGVGKTTTLAKMAGRAVLEQRKKVGFITTDTYRIAAIDQLKTYANILQAPFAVCYNADDFRTAKRNLADCDLVFVDTAGRNFRNPQYVAELQQTLEFDSETETFLVLAATGKYEDMKAVYDRFSRLPLDRLIITKLDETDSYGAVFSLLIDSRLGAAYFTNGQNVPDDMAEASADRLVHLLFGAERW